MRISSAKRLLGARIVVGDPTVSLRRGTLASAVVVDLYIGIDMVEEVLEARVFKPDGGRLGRLRVECIRLFLQWRAGFGLQPDTK